MSSADGGKPLLLIFPFGILSHYLRCLVLCRHLVTYFEVRIAYHPNFAFFIEQEKLATFNYEGLNSTSAVEAVKQFDFSWMNETALEQVYLEQVNIINEFKPAAVLGDYSLTLKMAAEATSVLYISLINGYMSKHYANYRKISRTHSAYPLIKKAPSSIQALLTKRGEAIAFRQLHKPFKVIRRRHKLQKTGGYLDELEGNITLICDLEELFPQHELPPGYLVIAPLFYEFYLSKPDLIHRLDRTKKTILASMGSTGDWQKLSFLNDPSFEKYNIVATGDHLRILHAAHITHVKFVNIHDLYPFTDLIICHGGNGTIYQALLYEIPILCKSSHCEQEWNIHALEENQVGICLDEITHIDNYKKIVQEHIDQKGSLHYRLLGEKIKSDVLQLPQLIKNVAEMVLTKPATAIMQINQY